MAYEPFIDDPGHIREVEGQRFVVLRPNAGVCKIHRHLQAVLRKAFGAVPISYPAQAHVTLAAFDAGTRLDGIQDLVDSWSRTVSPVRVTLERLASFPAPSQVVIIQVLNTPDLVAALSELRREAGEKRFSIDTTISPQDWVFHMSVAYCSKLNDREWNQLEQFVPELEVVLPSCVVNEAELVAFDEGREYSGGVYSLRAQT